MIGKDATALRHFLRELGPSRCVDNWLQGYGSLRTRTSYTGHLVLYRRWLKNEKVIQWTPDEMIAGNLRAVYESALVDVASKRRHLDLIATYVNEFMVKKGSADATRKVAYSSIVTFYEANDSAIQGHWKFADQPRPRSPRGSMLQKYGRSFLL
jgi:hypothetical protein